MSTKVFFTASFSGKKLYQEEYDTIVKSIQNCDVELISTELGNYKTLLPTPTKELDNHEEHYQAIKRGIQWADIVILEVTHESFQVGHEATLAIQRKVPVLCLSLKEDWSDRIHDPYFHAAQYSKFFVSEIIKDFIERHSQEKLSERFNLFLSKQQIARLEKKAQELGLNKSEYLRSLI